MPEQPDEHRAADWYELFFDLVFVVVIAVSAERLEHDLSPVTVLVFLLALFPLWWAWVNLMVANNLFGERFPVVGAIVIASMPGPAAMAIAIADGLDHHGWLYAAGAIWIRLALLAIWVVPFAKRATAVPLWRLVAYNAGTAAIWAISLFVPPPWQWILWGVAVAVEVFLLALRTGFSLDVYRDSSLSHALDRVGLFVVIVVGEAVYLSVTGLAAHPTIEGAAVGSFGLVVCALLARAYFRWGVSTTEHGLREARLAGSFGAMRDVVMYLPFLLVAALTLIAAAIGIGVDEADAPLPLGARLLLASGVGGFYLANAIAGLRLGRPRRGILSLVAPGIALPFIACLTTGALPAWATLGVTALAVVLLDLLGRRMSSSDGSHDRAIPAAQAN